MGSTRVAVLALVAGLLVASVAGASGGTAVRATLVSDEQPRAAGLLVGSLSGRTLSWRLTFDGLGASAPSANLYVPDRKPLVVRLCGPCVTGAAGRKALPEDVASAVRYEVAFVKLHAAKGQLSGLLRLGSVPSLQLVGIGDGAVLHLPAQVRFAVTGFRVAPGDGGIALLTAGREYRLRLATGVLTLPDDKMLTGKRDLTFVLVRPDGTRLANREARATVYGVVLAGRR